MSFASEPQTAWDLVRHGSFARLFWAGFISSVGDWAALFAQITLAAAIAGPTGILVVLAARLLPGLVGGAIGGVLADRVNRKVAILVSDFGRAVLVLSLAWVNGLGELFVISVGLELLTLIGQPARAAAVSDLVASPNLLTANSLMLGAAYGTFPIGAALSWILGVIPTFTIFGMLPETTEARVFFVDSVSFAVSGLLVLSIAFAPRRLDPGRQRSSRFDWRAPLRDLWEGVVFVARNSKVRPIVIGMSVALFGGGMLIVLGRTFAAETLQADEAGFFAVLTALGTGAAIGIIALSIYEDRIVRRDLAFAVSLLVTGAALMSASLVKTVPGAMAWLTVMGLGAGSAYVTGFTHLHEQVDQDLQGRTFAALFSLMRIGLLLAMTVAAPAADLLEGVLPSPLDNATRDLLFLGGLIVILAGFATLWTLRDTFHWPKLGREGLESMDAAGRAFFRLRSVRRRNNTGEVPVVTAPEPAAADGTSEDEETGNG